MSSGFLFTRRAFCCKFLLLAMVAAAISSFAHAQAPNQQHKLRQIMQNRQRFTLDKTIYVSAGFEDQAVATDFAAWLRSHGAAASHTISKTKKRVEFIRSASIAGVNGQDGWQITVKPRVIQVKYTTNHSLEQTLEQLKGLLVPGAVKYFPGGTYSDWGTRRETRDAKSTVDGATSRRSVADIESALRKQSQSSKQVFLTLISPTVWRMPSASLEVADPNNTLYPSDGCYTTKELQTIAAYCRQHRVDLVPTLDLLSENAPFQRTFGHSVFSVEGMRLVRAAIEDCVRIFKPGKICLGTITSQADARYLEFVSDLSNRLGVEIILLEL